MNYLSDNVLPHGVYGEAGSEPLLGGGHLPGADPAVQVPAQIHRHLGQLDTSPSVIVCQLLNPGLHEGSTCSTIT